MEVGEVGGFRELGGVESSSFLGGGWSRWGSSDLCLSLGCWVGAGVLRF